MYKISYHKNRFSLLVRHNKRNVFTIFFKRIFVILTIVFISGCQKNIPDLPPSPEPPTHKHTFEEAWSYDETYHFHKATCGHDEISNKAEHIFSNNICTICGYKTTSPEPPIHKHTFEETWSYDETYHFHKATCGHDEISNKAEHIFSNNTCTICGYKSPSPEPPQKIGIQYEYTNKAYSVVGLGLLDDYNIIIPNTFNDGVNGEHSVTSIGNKAFFNTDITSVILGDNISTIGENAFAYTPLTRIKMGNNVSAINAYAFSNCKNLTTIEWNKNLETIGSSAFENCSSLSEVTLPSSVLEVGNYAFSRVPNIKKLELGEKLKTLGNNAFGTLENLERIIYNSISLDTTTRFQNLPKLKTITIGENVCDIPSNFFESCPNLEEVVYNATNAKNAILLFNLSSLKTAIIGNNVQSIPAYIFSNAKELTTVTFGENVKNVGQRAFDNCISLINLTLNNALTYIDGYAFRQIGIDEITIPESITFIQGTAFQNCNNLKIIHWNSSNYNKEGKREYDGGIFEQSENIETVIFGEKANLVPDGLFTDIVSLKTIILSESIESIGYASFAGCINLTEITIPNGVKIIGEYAFRGSESLHIVNLSEGLIEIKDYAFLECRDLKQIILPDTLTKMTNAFAECTYLSSVHLGRSLSQIIGNEIFLGATCLERITIDNENKYYTVEDNVLYNKGKTTLIFYPPLNNPITFKIPDGIETISTNAFRDTINLENVTLPSSVQTIGNYAFMGSSIKNIVIPDNVADLTGTFAECLFLETVTIGKGVNNIDIEAFDAAANIKEFIVDAGNIYYSSVDGNLYNKSGNELFKYALGKENDEFIVSSSITKISKNAFVGAINLLRIVFENTENWYMSASEDMSNVALVKGLDDSENTAYILTDTDNYGSMYYEYRP